MLWLQHSYIIAGKERWFVNPGHCVFPMHKCKTKQGGCKNFFLALWKESRHAHKMTQPTTGNRKHQSPHVTYETWKPSWPPPWEHPFQALSKRHEIHAAVHTDISYISEQRGSCTMKLRGELLKTPRHSVALRRHHSFLVHLHRKGVSWVVRHWCSAGHWC